MIGQDRAPLAGLDQRLVDRAMSAISLHDQEEMLDEPVVRWLAPNLVLAETWNPMRIQRARAKLAAGERAPPIVVWGKRMGGEVWYSVEDGVHRTVAAREAGRKVRAKIRGYQVSDPDQFVIYRESLWRKTEDPSRIELRCQLRDLGPALRHLGVSEWRDFGCILENA